MGRGDSVVDGNTTHDGVISKKTLTFNPLQTSHGALYTCTADILDQSINLTKNGKEDVHLVVQCKYSYMYMQYIQTFDVLNFILRDK